MAQEDVGVTHSCQPRKPAQLVSLQTTRRAQQSSREMTRVCNRDSATVPQSSLVQ